MALIKRDSAIELSKGAVVLDLGDLRRQGYAILQAAQARADAVLADAKTERERLVTGAAAEGRTEGLAQGLADGHRQGMEQGRSAAQAEHRESLEKLTKGWTTALAAFEQSRERMLEEARRDVLRLAVAVATKVTKRAVTLDDRVATEQLAAVLRLVLRPTRLIVSINPADRAVLEAAAPALAKTFPAATHIELVDEPSLGRGSCVARLADQGQAAGEIDASIDTQLDRIVEALLPSAAAKEPTEPGTSAPAIPVSAEISAPVAPPPSPASPPPSAPKPDTAP